LIPIDDPNKIDLFIRKLKEQKKLDEQTLQTLEIGLKD
jgi:hypothetical protein